MKKLILILLLWTAVWLWAVTTHSEPSNVTLQWDANTQPVSHYAVWFGFRSKFHPHLYCTTTQTSVELTSLDPLLDPYYVAVKAYDNHEPPRPSEFSNEVMIDLCMGDFTNDGLVSYPDYLIFIADFGRSNCNQEPPCEGDFDYDGNVDMLELNIFLAEYGKTNCQ